MKQETIDRIRKFTADRQWEQYHTPANLAKSISIEAGELLECFQWSDEDYDLEHVKEELADVRIPLRVAVMGCVVNGPGEAREADIGVAFGDGNGVLIKKGEIVGSGSYEEILKRLVDEANAILGA